MQFKREGSILIGIKRVAIVFTLAATLLSSPANVKALGGTFSVREGNDYATQVLGDAWDMNEFSDVSQYFNQSGQNIMIDSTNADGSFVKDGVFSAKTLNTDASFTVLFPGYETAMLVGKTGTQYPIDANKYKCLYMAAKIDSNPVPNNAVPDVVRAMWFGDERLNGGGPSNYGFAQVQVEKDPNKAHSPAKTWRLQKIDFNKDFIDYAKWSAKAFWRGVRISPTSQATTFAVDWVRLTDCDSSRSTMQVSGLTNWHNYSFFVVSADREIEVERFTAYNSSYAVDLEGVAPGSYTYRLKDSGNTVQEGSLTVRQSPVVSFDVPAPQSGSDYATNNGNPWDFSDAADATKINDLQNPQLANGILYFTAHRMNDSYIMLNAPTSITSGAEYRYLSFRIYTEDRWQNVPKGMIARWVWQMRNSSGSGDCYMVSQDIPYNVGWQVITIDLWDSFNGSAKQWQGDCAGKATNWRDSKNIVGLRFDPNENELSYDMKQGIDWIRLSSEPVIRAGNPFTLSTNLNVSEATANLQYYYTTDPLHAPRQHPLSLYPSASPNSSGNVQPFGKYRVNIPSVYGGHPLLPSNTWQTNNVPPGEYNICTSAINKDDTGGNGDYSGIFCSQSMLVIVQ